MKMKAAVLYEPNTPLVVEEIDIDEPKEKEVMVKIKAVGLCHTDLHYIKGDMPAVMPMVLGHEGAGIVEAVGPGVTRVKPGDHVLMSVNTPCGECVRCLSGQNYRCENSGLPMAMGTQYDGTTRLSKDEETIYHCFSQSSFAEYSIKRETGMAKIRDDAPFEKICTLGCGLTTGLGAVLRHPMFTPEIGSSVVVFGCGPVGLSVIMGAKLANVKHIAAVDVLDNKLAMAMEVGATLTVNAAKENAAGRIVLEIGPVDYAFDCVGSPELITQGFAVTKDSGMIVVVGAAPMGVTVPVECFSFITGKNLVGVNSGFMRPAVDLPNYVDLYMDGKLPLDKLVTHHFKLEEINEAIDSLQRGEVIKAVIIP